MPISPFPRSSTAAHGILSPPEIRHSILPLAVLSLAVLHLAVKEQRVSLVNGRHADAGNVYMRRPPGSPHNRVGNVLGCQRRQPLVDLGRAPLVAMKTNQAEIGLHHAGIDAGYP